MDSFEASHVLNSTDSSDNIVVKYNYSMAKLCFINDNSFAWVTKGGENATVEITDPDNVKHLLTPNDYDVVEVVVVTSIKIEKD